MDDEAPQWFTDAQRGDFKVGDEVTIDLGECSVGGRHGSQEQNVRGMVIGTDGLGSPYPDSHPICVLFRWPLPLTRSYLTVWWYAPSELRHFDIMAAIAEIARST